MVTDWGIIMETWFGKMNHKNTYNDGNKYGMVNYPDFWEHNGNNEPHWRYNGNMIWDMTILLWCTGSGYKKPWDIRIWNNQQSGVFEKCLRMGPTLDVGVPNCWTNQFPNVQPGWFAWNSLLHKAEISNKYAEVSHAKHHLSNISTYSMYIAYVYIHQYKYIYIYIHTYVSGWLYIYIYTYTISQW